MADRCKEKDCTVAQTGICLLNNDPKTCPQRIASETTTGVDVAAALGDLAKPAQNPTFPNTLALSLTDASTLMAGRSILPVGRNSGLAGRGQDGASGVHLSSASER
jgi:hypothetical protein